MSFDRPAARWLFAVAAALTAYLLHVVLHPATTPGGMRYVPFLVAVAVVAVMSGRAPAVLTLMAGLAAEAIYDSFNIGSSLTGRADIGRESALYVYLLIGTLIIAIGHQARRHALETRRVRAELRRALAAAGVGSWNFEFKTGKFSYSENVGPMIGRDGGFVHRSLDQWRRDIHPDDLAPLRAALDAARGGEAYELKYRLRTPANEWRWLLVRGRIAHDAHGVLQRADGIVMDVTSARTAELDRWRLSEELRTMLDLVPGGVTVAHDTTGDHVTVSAGWARMLGVADIANVSSTGSERHRLPYRCMRDGKEIPPDELPVQATARTGREQRNVELDLVYADGRTVNLLTSVAPLFDADGKLRGSIGMHTDITTLKQAQRELERVGRQKDIFLATLAHELRNPLAPVRYAAALLRNGADATIIEEARRVIERQTSQMSQLLDELLDMSRITRDVIELRREPVDLGKVVRQEIDALRPRLCELDQKIEFTVAEAAWVTGDMTRLHQVVNNLLSNAVKYSNPGGCITVRVEVVEAQTTLRVRDCGVGIARADLERVFDLFSQVRKPGVTPRGGLGIGLAVVRRLVELHGGRIEAFSEGLGTGAEFFVTLPRTAVAPVVSTPPIAPVAEQGSCEHAGRPRVLVVDDNVDAADTLAELLRAQQVDVRVAYDGVGATAEADAFHPGLVLLDLGLPGKTGEEVAVWIRSRPWGRICTLVAVTGWGQPQDRARTAIAGFDQHLVKPVEPSQILELVRQVGAAGRTTTPVAGTQPEPATVVSAA